MSCALCIPCFTCGQGTNENTKCCRQNLCKSLWLGMFIFQVCPCYIARSRTADDDVNAEENVFKHAPSTNVYDENTNQYAKAKTVGLLEFFLQKYMLKSRCNIYAKDAEADDADKEVPSFSKYFWDVPAYWGQELGKKYQEDVTDAEKQYDSRLPINMLSGTKAGALFPSFIENMLAKLTGHDDWYCRCTAPICFQMIKGNNFAQKWSEVKKFVTCGKMQ